MRLRIQLDDGDHSNTLQFDFGPWTHRTPVWSAIKYYPIPRRTQGEYAILADVPLLSFIAALQHELDRHTWDTFIDDPAPIAQGGKGVVVMGCPACRVRLYTHSQFMRHLTQDVLPRGVQKAVQKEKKPTKGIGERSTLP